MADCLSGGLVAGETMVVLDAGAYGKSVDETMTLATMVFKEFIQITLLCE
jgi:hypothetical protein